MMGIIFTFSSNFHTNFFTKSMNFYVQKNNTAISILIEEDKEEGRERRRDGGEKLL